MSSALRVRERRPADVEPLLELLDVTQREQGYPADPSYVRGDFLVGPHELGAWVAVLENRLVGHVSLLPPHGASAPLWASATGRPAEGIAVVSRLFSGTPGAGSALLSQAVAAARTRGRTPVLEVERDSPAVGFYLQRGWRTVGEVQQHWRAPSVTVSVMVSD